jgi:TorA maturation chaperone TorD
MSASPLQFASPGETPGEAEELARAEAYGLLARLFHAPPDEGLLAQFAHIVTEAAEPGAFLEAPWGVLVAAMRDTSVPEAAEEYDALFMGVGKSEVMLYGSFYLAGTLNEKPLAQLRQHLATLGLTREAGAAETEDHVAFVFEVMRYLIAGHEVAVCNLEQQRRFFRAQVQPWVEALCDAIEAHPRANVWRTVAGYTRAFIQVETQAFDLID